MSDPNYEAWVKRELAHAEAMASVGVKHHTPDTSRRAYLTQLRREVEGIVRRRKAASVRKEHAKAGREAEARAADDAALRRDFDALTASLKRPRARTPSPEATARTWLRKNGYEYHPAAVRGYLDFNVVRTLPRAR